MDHRHIFRNRIRQSSFTFGIILGGLPERDNCHQAYCTKQRIVSGDLDISLTGEATFRKPISGKLQAQLLHNKLIIVLGRGGASL
jgi:hypothetical protein